MISKQKGQVTIEAVLLIAIFVSVMYAGSKIMKDQRILSRLVEEPWAYVAGMIENGIWATPNNGKVNHPNHITRHGTPFGDNP